MRSLRWGLQDGIYALIKRSGFSFLCFHQVKTQQECGCVHTRKRVAPLIHPSSPDNSSANSLILEFPISRTMWNKGLLLKPGDYGILLCQPKITKTSSPMPSKIFPPKVFWSLNISDNGELTTYQGSSLIFQTTKLIRFFCAKAWICPLQFSPHGAESAL